MDTNQRYFVALSDDVPLGITEPMFGVYDHEGDSTEWAIRQFPDRDKAEQTAARWNTEGKVT